MRKIFAIIGLFGIAVLTGCGANSNSVQAATTYTYSSSSFTGTYAVIAPNTGSEELIGTFTADGNGNITGAVTYIVPNGAGVLTPACSLSVTGTYTIQGTGAGTATLKTVPGGSSPCDSSANGLAVLNASFLMEVSQQGSMIYFLDSSIPIFASKQ